MESAKVVSLYITVPDSMRSGYRKECEFFECDEGGIVGSKNYDKGYPILLVCNESYKAIEEAGLSLDRGVLMEDICIDINIYHLDKGDIVEIGEALFEVIGHCENYDYLYALDPELPTILKGKRGLFVKPIYPSSININDRVKIIEKRDD